MIGQMVSHYEILEKLGEGGMGIVYKARDTRLERLVALKFLPPHLSATEADRERMLQEAKAAAALNHPNVCSLIDIQESGGRPFLVMEYVDGSTLRDRLSKRPGIAEAIDYALQIGDALQAAHDRGIVHRDIKSENIMVTADGRIKVMDFGLARLRGSAQLTRTSSTVGTLSYMAPEQIQGVEADARSDIFSLGVVCFELLTGRLPFRGEHEAALIYSILNQQPDSLLAARPDAPAELDRILHRAMEKDPEDRYQHVAEMTSELRRLKRQTGRVPPPVTADGPPESRPPASTRPIPRKWIVSGIALAAVVIVIGVLYRTVLSPGGSSPSAKKMLVVVPFDNLGSSDQEYFADGITEEITSRLSGLSGLGVIARSSATQYKRTSKSVKQVGQELGVSYILQGTVRWENAGGETHVRVTPQLINVADGTQMWSEPFESVLSGAFKLQSEIAGNVARALDVALLQPEKRSLEANVTTNAEAYDNYLRGLAYFNRSYDEKDIRLAEQLLTKAVQLDPDFASAYAFLSLNHSLIYWEYYDHTEGRVVRAREAAEKSLRLDPTLAASHVALGMYYYHGKMEYENALKELGQALVLQPNNVEAMLGIGAVKRRQGKFEEAAMNFAKAAEIDPRAGALSAELALTYMYLRRFSEAERYADKAIALTPDWPEPYSHKAYVHLLRDGNIAKTRAVLDEAASRNVGWQDVHFTFTALTVNLLDGKYQEALDVLSRYQAPAFDVQEYFLPIALLRAQVYGYMKSGKAEHAAYDSARVVLEQKVREHPEDSRFHSSLGIAYAGLGRKDEAVKEGKLALDQIPISRDAIRGAYRAGDLAQVYVMTGEQEPALDLLEQLLKAPSPFSTQLIRLDPLWAPLRGNPRYQKLISGNG